MYWGSTMPQSDELHRRARAFVHAFETGGHPPESFDSLACDLARHQAAHSEGYARLCRARGVDVRTIDTADEAPAVPTDAFKMTRVATFPEGEARVTFRTSGTTAGAAARGVHAMRDVTTYDEAALAFGRTALVEDLYKELPGGGFEARRIPVLVVGPSPEVLPDSSLTHMIDLFARELGTPASRAETYFLDADGVLDLESFDTRVARALVDGSDAVLVLGTSFAFVHFLEAIGDELFRLPPKSRVMQTGGYKGKSREVAPAELRRDLARAFCIDPKAIVSEYGMTELSSQFYEWTVRDPEAKPGVYVEPPWARVIPVDPETLEPVKQGEIGIARIEDLMNVDSAFAVLAADRVRRVEGGFELLGRAPGAVPRGCSIAIDEMMAR